MFGTQKIYASQTNEGSCKASATEPLIHDTHSCMRRTDLHYVKKAHAQDSITKPKERGILNELEKVVHRLDAKNSSSTNVMLKSESIILYDSSRPSE